MSLILRGRSGPSPATAAKVLAVAERHGYRANRAASQLASRRTGLLGVTMTPNNPYHSELVEEIQATTDAHGYEVLLAAVSSTHDERRSIETLVDSNCEAMVLLGPILPAKTLRQLVSRIPAVCLGRPLDLPGIDVVRSADIPAMELLVEHLTELGHTKIAHVDGGDLYLPAERRRGYEAAMRSRGLTPLVISGGETEDSGIMAGAELLRHRGVTAVVAYNDMCALGVIDHLLRNGLRVPEDMSVTGFDDDRLVGLAPINLTTINPSKLEQARLAVEMALERADGSRTERIIRVAEARLMVRGTTAPPAVARSAV